MRGRLVIGALLGTSLSLAVATPTYAQLNLCPQGEGAFSNICQSGDVGISTVLGTAVNFVFIVAIILAFAFLIYGGIRWITSGGDKGGVANARGTIIAAIVGLIVVFLSYVILNVVLQLFGTNLSALTIPTIGGGGGTGAEGRNQQELLERNRVRESNRRNRQAEQDRREQRRQERGR